MGREVLSVRQMMILLLVALFGPVVDLLPGMAANRGGWIASLAALPLLLAAVWANSKVLRAERSCKRIRKPIGCTIIIMYMAWSFIVLAAVLRLSAVRMERIYPAVPSWLFGAAVAAVAVWMGMGKVPALARAAEVFYLGLSVLLVGILLLAAFQVEWKNLLGVDWRMVPGGGITIAGVCMCVAPVAVLGNYTPKKVRGLRKAFGWTGAFVGGAGALAASVIGILGNGLSGRLETPFLIMVQGLRIRGAFQRTEALVAAVLLLSDVVFVGALLRAWKAFAEQIKTGRWGRQGVPIVAAAALAVGWLLLPEGNDARMAWSKWLSAGGLIFGLVIPFFLLVGMSGSGRKRR